MGGNKYPSIFALHPFHEELLTLDHLLVGQSATISNVASSLLTARLTEMGLYLGQHVKVLFKAPLGDPIAVQVGDYVVALRNAEARLVEVESDDA